MYYTLKKFKIGIVISLIISFSLSYYIYHIEDKNTIYKSNFTLDHQSSYYNNILKNNLLTTASYFNNNTDHKCEIDVDTEKNFSIMFKIIVSPKIEDKTNYTQLVSDNCLKILTVTMNDYVEFNKGVINFFNSKTKENVQAVNQIFQISQRIYFIEHLINKLYENKLQFKKIYSPPSADEHILTFAIIFLLLSSIYIGISLSKDNLKIVKEKKRKSRD